MLTDRPTSITTEQLAQWSDEFEAEAAKKKETAEPGDKENFISSCWLAAQLVMVGAPEDDVSAVCFANGQKGCYERDPWGTAQRSLAQYKTGEWDRPGMDLALRLIRKYPPQFDRSDAQRIKSFREELDRLGLSPEQALSQLNSTVPEAGLASIAATRAFNNFLDELPTQWNPEDQRWKGIRAWAIDEIGQIQIVPTEEVVMPDFIPDRDIIQKDAITSMIARWAAKQRPHAMLVSSEVWKYSMPDADRERMVKELGRTPDLTDPENREILRRNYHAETGEGLMMYGELLGQLPAHRIFEIVDGKIRPTHRGENLRFRSMFEGILAGDPNLSRSFS